MSHKKRKGEKVTNKSNKTHDMESSNDVPSTSKAGLNSVDSSFLDSEPSEAYKSATVSDLSECKGKVATTQKCSFKRIPVSNTHSNLPMVHNQVMKLVDSSILFEKKALKRKSEGGQEKECSGDDEYDDKIRCLKKKTKKVLATTEEISRPSKEYDPKTKYFRCEALQSGISNRVRNEPEDLSLMQINEASLWMTGDQQKPATSEQAKCEITGDFIPALTGNEKSVLRKIKEPSSIIYSKEAEEKLMKFLIQRIFFQPQILIMCFHVQVDTTAINHDSIETENDIPPNEVEDNGENEDEVPLGQMGGPPVEMPAEEAVTDSDDEPFLGFPDPESKEDTEHSSAVEDSDCEAFPNFVGFLPDSDAEITDAKEGEGEDSSFKEEEAVARSSSEPHPSTSSFEPKASTSSSSSDVLEGDNPVPTEKTEKMAPLKYALRPKCVDIKRLKEVMISLILNMIEERENEASSDTRPTIWFKDLLAAVYNSEEWSDRAREDLSCQMAFMALLYLANEYSLNLEQEDVTKTSDVKISFFGEKPSRADFPGLYSAECQEGESYYDFHLTPRVKVSPPEDDSEDESGDEEK